MTLPVQRPPARHTLTVLAPDAASCAPVCDGLAEEGWELLWATRRQDGQVELVLVQEHS